MAELIVEADPDSFMSKFQHNINFGSIDFIVHDVTYNGVDKDQWRRGIGNFDVSALAGATINSAKLVREIWTITNGGVDVILSRCTRPADWVEDEVTWDQYRVLSPWTNVGGDFDDAGPPAMIVYTEASATGTHEVTGLKDFVEDALANRSGIVSLITRLAQENPGSTTQYGWRSKEYGSDIWRLVIDYTPPALPTNPGRRGLRRSALAREAPAIRPARVARPARTTSGVAPARPHRPRRTA